MAWPSASVAGRPMLALPKPVRLILSCGALHVANSIAHAPLLSRHSWSMLADRVELGQRAPAVPELVGPAPLDGGRGRREGCQ